MKVLQIDEKVGGGQLASTPPIPGSKVYMKHALDSQWEGWCYM